MFVDAVVILVASLGGVQRLIFVCAFLSSCAGWWGPEVGLDFPVVGRCLARSAGAEEGRRWSTHVMGRVTRGRGGR